MLLFQRIVGALLATITLIVAFFFSVVILAVVVAGAAIVLGYLWWKTRALRRAAKDMHARPFDDTGHSGRTIDATEVYEVPNEEIEDKTRRPPP